MKPPCSHTPRLPKAPCADLPLVLSCLLWSHMEGYSRQPPNLDRFTKQSSSARSPRCFVGQPCQLKGNTAWELKLSLGQDEDYGLGDSISDSSKELLWRAGGKVSRYDSGERGVCAIKHTFLNKVAAPQGAVVNIHNFSAFLNISRCEN